MKVKSKKYLGVYKSILKSGDISYYVTYKDETDKKVWLKIGTKSQGITEVFCFNKRNEILLKLRHGEDVPLTRNRKNKKIKTLNDLSKIYFDCIEHTHKDYKNMLSRYNLHLKDVFGNRFIDDITVKELQDFQVFKLKTHSPKTINHLVQLLGTIYNHNIKHDNLKVVNPATKVSKLKVDNARERFLTTKEINILYIELENNSTLYLFVKLALTTGARVSSICNIKRKDINLDNKLITIKDYKNDSTYTAYLTNETLQLLQDRLLNDNINININDNIIDYKQDRVQKNLKFIFDRLYNNNLDTTDRKNRVVTHTLRHTFASHLAINGTPIFTIQKLMNHKDIGMTMRYAKLAPDSGQVFINNL